MKAYIHIGMHKTGTSSIQDTLAALAPADPRYLLANPATHSAVVSLLFEDERSQAVRFEARGWSPAQIERKRTLWRGALEDALATHTGRAVVFSAERLVGVPPAAVQRMRDFFARTCREIEVIGYVRPPVSWMESAFQQVVREQLASFDALAWPGYRSCFEKFDTLLGRENVVLKPFLRDRLTDGDVVADFAAHLGITVPPEAIRRENTSSSLEALALIYVKRRFGEPIDWRLPGTAMANRRFIDRLLALGSTRFRLAGALVAPLVARNQADLDYIEARLATSLIDVPAEGAAAICGEDDLVAAALSAAPLLEPLVGAEPGERTLTVETLAARLDRFFLTCRNEVSQHPALRKAQATRP